MLLYSGTHLARILAESRASWRRGCAGTRGICTGHGRKRGTGSILFSLTRSVHSTAAAQQCSGSTATTTASPLHSGGSCSSPSFPTVSTAQSLDLFPWWWFHSFKQSNVVWMGRCTQRGGGGLVEAKGPTSRNCEFNPAPVHSVLRFMHLILGLARRPWQ